MTPEEKQEIINAVLAELTDNSEAASEIDDATSVNDVKKLPGIDADGAFIMMPTSMIDAHHVTLSQAEYDALVDAEATDASTYYYITEATS